ncbi:MAG: hypothetical protein LWY06_10405 [Firmicutes bacterium]|nr:hypothetical protein [Bacillota bacterium]
MERSNAKIKSTNFGLIFIIVLITAAISMGIYLFAQSKLGIRGYSWIFASLFWLVANFFITYFDSMFKEHGSVAAFMKALWECALLFIAGLTVMFFLNFSMIPGILIFAIFTFIKMSVSYNPYTHVLEKIVYADRSEIEALQRTGIWISEEILELESMDQLPKPAVKQVKARFKETAPPPSVQVKVQPKSLKLEKVSTHSDKPGAEKEKADREEPAKPQKPLTEEAAALVDVGRAGKMPEKLEDILNLARKQLLSSKGERYLIPTHLTQKGTDEIPREIPVREQGHMDDKDRIEILFVTVLKDMSDLFNMKLGKIVETRITFPWELSSGRRMKLTERLKVGEQDIISITGALSEDFTYALIAANLADIWFEENAQADVGEYKSGFHFWLAYKLLKNRDFIDAALQASKQNPAQFGKIREIEEESGEYGVIRFLTTGKIQTQEITEKIITVEKKSEAKPQPVKEKEQISAPAEVKAEVKAEIRESDKKVPEEIFIKPSEKKDKLKIKSHPVEVKPEEATAPITAIIKETVVPQEENKKSSEPETVIPKAAEETLQKSGPVEINRDAAMNVTSSEKAAVSGQAPGVKPPPQEIKRVDAPEEKPKKEQKETRKVLGVPVSVITDPKKGIKEKVRMDPALEASLMPEKEEKPEKVLPMPEKPLISVPKNKILSLDIPHKEEKEEAAEVKQDKGASLFRKADVKLGKEESKKIIPLDLDMTRMLKIDRDDIPQLLKSGKIISLSTGEIENIKKTGKPSDEDKPLQK